MKEKYKVFFTQVEGQKIRHTRWNDQKYIIPTQLNADASITGTLFKPDGTPHENATFKIGEGFSDIQSRRCPWFFVPLEAGAAKQFFLEVKGKAIRNTGWREGNWVIPTKWDDGQSYFHGTDQKNRKRVYALSNGFNEDGLKAKWEIITVKAKVEEKAPASAPKERLEMVVQRAPKHRIGDMLVAKKTIEVEEKYKIIDELTGNLGNYYFCLKQDGSSITVRAEDY